MKEHNLELFNIYGHDHIKELCENLKYQAIDDGFEKFIEPLFLKKKNYGDSLFISLCKLKETDQLIAFTITEMNKNTSEAIVWGLYVLGDWRRNKLGSLLLRHTVGSIVGNGMKKIFISFIDPEARRGHLYGNLCENVLPLYRPKIAFCIVASSVSEKRRIWDWIPV